jgi:hypothetical protein
MSGKQWLIGGLCVLAVVVWTVAASQLFLFVCGLWGQISDPVMRATAWWVYAFSPYAAERSIKLTLALTATIPAAMLAPLFLLARAKQRRDSQNVYGKTGWASTADMQRGGIERSRLP